MKLEDIVVRNSVVTRDTVAQDPELRKQIQTRLSILKLYPTDRIGRPSDAILERAIADFCTRQHLNSSETGLYGASFAKKLLQASTIPSRAIFRMTLQKTSRLVIGELGLLDTQGKQMRTYAVTSGAPGHQGADDLWKVGKGPCPDLKDLQISTQAQWCPQVRGVEGWYYQILPVEMHGVGGTKRSYIGVHRDANSPGSAGCLVFQDDKIFNEDFVLLMKVAAAVGVKSIPLRIEYSSKK